MIARVLLRTRQPEIDRAFDYLVPEDLVDGLCPGMRVLVPFGSRNTRTEGFVLELTDYTEVPTIKAKLVLERLEEYPMFSWEALELAQWMAKEYDCTLSQCLQAMMPPGLAAVSSWMAVATGVQVQLTPRQQAVMDRLNALGGQCQETDLRVSREMLKRLSEKGVLTLTQTTRTPAHCRTVRWVELTVPAKEALAALGSHARVAPQQKLVQALEAGGQEVRGLLTAAGLSESPLLALKKKGLVRVFPKEVYLSPVSQMPRQPALMPTPDQAAVLERLTQWRREKMPLPVLLHGVTGSGKTEVYLQLIEQVLAEGKQAIFLVPEISLTPQMVNRVVSRFGDRVAVTHSRLSATERHDQWKRARTGAASVMVGPRSAVFAPFPNLGLVILDEEHENSYRSEQTPKYQTAAVAQQRCRLTGAMLLLGSATPSIETYYRTQTGEIRLLTLPERIGGGGMPKVFIQDMREELMAGNKTEFSRALGKALRETLAAGKQALLFLNRRGYSTFVSCRKCGYVATCESCAVSYTYHAADNKLRCHYCGREADPPTVCPVCGSPYIRYFGAGTQRLEAAVRRYFPTARVLRMDADTTRKKGGYARILESFSRGDADILIGTQMIAKGHDFPNVTLVGIMAADLSLHFSDFRAAETTFQLLTQAAGRAGRREEAGRVYIQTYSPRHYAVQCAARQDYLGFYKAELALRRQMDYPPFSHIASILVQSPQEDACQEAAKALAVFLEPEVEVLGPAPAVLSKLKDQYRWRLLLRDADKTALRQALRQALERFHQKRHTGVLVDVTMDPSVML